MRLLLSVGTECSSFLLLLFYAALLLIVSRSTFVNQCFLVIVLAALYNLCSVKWNIHLSIHWSYMRFRYPLIWASFCLQFSSTVLLQAVTLHDLWLHLFVPSTLCLLVHSWITIGWSTTSISEPGGCNTFTNKVFPLITTVIHRFVISS